MSEHDPIAAMEAEFIRNNPSRRVLVNSIPKSGTTWVRTMMALLPGYEEYPRAGVSGLLPEQLRPVRPGQVFHGHIISSQALFDILDELDFATVFVYRDLRDVVVSDYFHRTKLNPRRAPAIFAERHKSELLHPAFLRQWCGSVNRYADVREWIARGYPTIRYEDLKRDTARELARVFQEMGLKVSPAHAASIAERAFVRGTIWPTSGHRGCDVTTP